MTQSSEEARLIHVFAGAYTAVREGLLKGAITPTQHLQLIDLMGSAFRDYLVLQQAGVAAKMAIEKAKYDPAAPAKSN